MEVRLGHDFSPVRIHDDPAAAASAADIGARAYTFGNHVVLGANGFPASSSDAGDLLTHELIHVMQQSGTPAGAPTAISSPHDAAEVDARAGRLPPVRPARPGVVHRDLIASSRAPDPRETAILDPVFGASLDYGKIRLVSDTGMDNRPWTQAVLGLGTFIHIGPTAYASPGSDPSTLVHEATHSWQSQHHSDPSAYMGNAIGSMAMASLYGGSAYCYVTRFPFSQWAAEQAAQAVECGEPAARAHVKGVAKGAVDPDNVAGLSQLRYERPETTGVRCRC